MEEASPSMETFRASAPEDTLAAEPFHHPQHCLNLLQRAQKTESSQRPERRPFPARRHLQLELVLHAHPCQHRGSCRQSWDGSRALTQSLKPPRHFHLQSTGVIIHQQFIVLKFSAVSSQLGGD